VGHILRDFDLSTHASKSLLEGELDWWASTWSPDGQMIAIHKKEPNKSSIYVASVGVLANGNIWVVPISSGEARQVTFLQGAAFRPTWSPDGRFLSFVTHDGQIGLTALDRPDMIWRAGEGSPDWPVLTSMFFLSQN
jgi:Tol biopolymer transport system component